MLECSRESLHITAAKTGQVIGDLWFDEANDNEICCDGGVQIPNDVEHKKYKDSKGQVYFVSGEGFRFRYFEEGKILQQC